MLAHRLRRWANINQAYIDINLVKKQECDI